MNVIKTFTITNELGIHARSAAMIVEVSNRYRAKICLEKNGSKVNAKSILGILTLGCPKGSRIIIRAAGIDAEEAVEELGRLIENKFGEN
jgi:phosphocarrier protein HPr